MLVHSPHMLWDCKESKDTSSTHARCPCPESPSCVWSCLFFFNWQSLVQKSWRSHFDQVKFEAGFREDPPDGRRHVTVLCLGHKGHIFLELVLCWDSCWNQAGEDFLPLFYMPASDQEFALACVISRSWLFYFLYFCSKDSIKIETFCYY